MGKPELAMGLLVAYYIPFRIPFAFVLAPRFGLEGIWSAFLVSHVLACMLAFAMMYFIRRISLRKVAFRSVRVQNRAESV